MTAPLPTLAITGSSGGLGGFVARQLSEAGLAQRLLVRDVARAPVLDKSVALPFSYADRLASERALEGAVTLFMVSASESAERVRDHCAFIDSAKACGVEHVVYTSFIGASADATFTLARDHYWTEEHIKASGLGYTFLRYNIYIDFVSQLVGDDGVIRGPAGTGRVAVVARADVARVAARVLQAPTAHRNATYDLTGPESLSMLDIAGILSAARGTRVMFHDETLAEAYESRKKWQVPDWQIAAWVSTYGAIASNELAPVSGAVEQLTGIPPLSLAAFLAATGG